MRVSIVTISYNQAEFLERAILSVLEQDYHNIEYIVVDPGSTDESRKIIDKYSHRISKTVLEPDNGPADGLNAGFRQASGDVFAFLNADDIFIPGAISRVVRYFKANENCDVVSGHSYVIDPHDCKIRISYSDRYSLLMRAYGASILMQPSTYFRSQLFKKVGGFNNDNRSNWDGELFTDMGLAGGRFALVNECLSGYRLHETSITSSQRLAQEHKDHYRRMFHKIMGREMKRGDIAIKLLMRLIKHIRNPQGVYQRLRFGPVFGGNVKK